MIDQKNSSPDQKDPSPAFDAKARESLDLSVLEASPYDPCEECNGRGRWQGELGPAECWRCYGSGLEGGPPARRALETGVFSNCGTPANLTLADTAAARAKIEALCPPPSPEALDQASFLGFFALGVPCCAGADGLRIRVVALEPVTPLDLSIARMKLARWYPWAAKVVELAAAGCWVEPRRTEG
jgi:hypothetical protein